MPFGSQGRWLKSGPLSYVLGGWSVSMIHNYQSGGPMKMYTWTYDSSILQNAGFRPDVLLPRDQQTLTKPENVIVDVGVPYLNKKAFADLPSTPGGMPLRFGNAPRYQPDLRGWHNFGEDLSLIKRTPIKVTEDPKYIQASSQIENLRQDLAGTVMTSAQKLKATLDAARAAETALNEAQQKQEAVALELSKLAIVYGVLTREVQADRALYESVLNRMRETDVTKELQPTTIREVQPAYVPTSPFSPRVKP